MSDDSKSDDNELEQLRELLVRAAKMASLGGLVAGVAHDINTPLGSIKANADMAAKLAARIRKRVPDDPKIVKSLDAQDRALSTLILAVDRIHAIVSSLRAFSRSDGPDHVDADLHEGLDTSLRLVSHMFEGRVTAIKNYGSLPAVPCRLGQINQVFMNLLTNAVQAIEGEGTITVTTQVVGDQVEISIEDSGAGISAENQAKMFTTGFTTKEAGTGTGLGLGISCRIIREHGGTIEVTSEPGAGACFVIRLPMTKKADD